MKRKVQRKLKGRNNILQVRDEANVCIVNSRRGIG